MRFVIPCFAYQLSIGEYLAYYTSDLLNATFSVYFRYNIFGAIALQNFSEMLKSKYEKEKEVVTSAKKTSGLCKA